MQFLLLCVVALLFVPLRPTNLLAQVFDSTAIAATDPDFMIQGKYASDNGSSAESVGTNPLKTEFASANDGIFERKHQG